MYEFHAQKVLLPLIKRAEGMPSPGERQGFISDATSSEDDPQSTSQADQRSETSDPYLQFAMQDLGKLDPDDREVIAHAKWIRSHFNKIKQRVPSVAPKEDDASLFQAGNPAGGKDSLERGEFPVDAGLQ